MSWFNPIIVALSIAFLFFATIAVTYLISGIRLFLIGKKEENFVKKKSAVVTILISGFSLLIITLLFFNVYRFIHIIFHY